MKVEVEIYDLLKYKPEATAVARAEYDIKTFHVAHDKEATKIASETDEDGRDEYNEYLVLTLMDGSTATFRNSHVDMFRVR